MYAIRLAFILVLAAGCLADFLNANAIGEISSALQKREKFPKTINSYVVAAESFLETQMKGVHLFNGNKIDVLKKFIAAGKSIIAGDCSESSAQLINSLPYSTINSADEFTWRGAINQFDDVRYLICSDKKLYSTLNRKQVDQISQITKIVIPIVKGDDDLSKTGLGEAGSVICLSHKPHTDLLNKLKEDAGSKQFNDELMKYFEKEGKQASSAESFNSYVTKPCQYYTGATSSIFEDHIYDYRELDVDNEEFNLHFLGYKVCKFLEREKYVIS